MTENSMTLGRWLGLYSDELASLRALRVDVERAIAQLDRDIPDAPERLCGALLRAIAAQPREPEPTRDAVIQAEMEAEMEAALVRIGLARVGRQYKDVGPNSSGSSSPSTAPMSQQPTSVR